VIFSFDVSENQSKNIQKHKIKKKYFKPVIYLSRGLVRSGHKIKNVNELCLISFFCEDFSTSTWSSLLVSIVLYHLASLKPLLNGLAYDPVRSPIFSMAVRAAVAFTRPFMLGPLLRWRGDLIFCVPALSCQLGNYIFAGYLAFQLARKWFFMRKDF